MSEEPKKRGRPRKNALPAANDAPALPAKKRGRPKAAKKTGTPAVAPPGKPRIVVERGASGFTVTFEGMTQEQVATLIATL